MTAMDDEEDFAETFMNDDASTISGLASSLHNRLTKDAVPLQAIAKCISPLAEHVFEAGKVLHIVLPGCNTINVCYHLKESLPERIHHIVYILCTSDVWPGDLSHIMWSQYGTNLTADLSHFRAATRRILDEYTHHFKRQRILDQSMQAAAKKKSRQRLSDAVYLDRLDRICTQNSGQNIEMQSL